MRTPAYWYAPPGLAARLLRPAGGLFAAIGKVRQASITPEHPGVPVICVGNLVAGGAGKTPVALAIASALTDRSVHFLTRGYGGRETGPILVEGDRHDAAAVGDEALLLARARPTWVARDRVAGAKAAAAAGAEVIVMDDGFQNPRLAKDLSILVVDGGAGFGNGHVIPAGPLREPVADGLARADAVVVLGRDVSGVAEAVGAKVPVLHARLVPDPAVAGTLRGRRVVAFAGIGRPAKFFATVEEIGAQLVGRIAFADHHPYAPDEVMRLVEHAASLDAALVTTAKDAVRLPRDAREMVQTIPVTVAWDDPKALDRLLTLDVPMVHGH
ncbi:tetraacyldisaccharide 4'-kinase [Skermanella stibiiresistens SB22]|uniref:Tetraacyldisaccharide 4'-kinase n=1 Tax=Skermanella stibiiresistens SB22 TaxID=1385369 RepID=W9H6D7_9PROT|nr:tetraacyldisaccharide 4'-kinase [Skermanella stibiiresistens]EWY40356.1 tetraacyldisaccharide 4'-kinase [Skermanella stibiiresistens SB22]